MTSTEELIYTVSTTCCGLLWTTSYLLILRRARLDKAHGMPLAPLCVNISYEFIFGVLHPDKPPLNIVNIIWLLIDLWIGAQYLRYARAEFPAAFPRWLFHPMAFASLAIAFTAVLTLTYDLQDWQGNYTGWGDQMLISLSFIVMLGRRASVRGQSMYIALSRCLGTLTLIPAQYVLTPGGRFVTFVYVAYFLIDITYMLLLARQCRLEGINPWKRL
jgi:hypothetical protein